MNDLVMNTRNEVTASLPIDDSLAARWESYIDVSPKSKDTYKKGIKSFLSYLKEKDIQHPTREDIISWRNGLKAGHRANTVQTYMSAIRLFFRWLSQEGIYPNIAEHIKGMRIEKTHKKDYLTSRQAHKVLVTIDTEELKGIRDFAIVSLAMTTGLRTVEIARADIADIRTVGEQTVLFIQGKGRDEKAEYVEIIPDVEDAIRDYLARRGASQDEPLFTSTSNNNRGERMTTRSISQICKDAMVEAGFDSDRLTAHSLRHTAGTLALLNGATPMEVKQILRHSSIETTMIYVHEIDRAKNTCASRVGNAIF